MTIKKIRILGLFGTFNHEIRLENNVVIIMGENGVGKTITLRMIESIFTRNFDYLISKEFEKIIISFNKETWTIKRNLNNDKQYSEYGLCIKSSKKNTEPFIVTASMLMPRIPSIFERVGEDKWYNRRMGEYYTRAELFERYGSESPILNCPEWYSHQCQQNKVTLIRTQRLYQHTGRDERQMLSVRKYSRDLSTLMQEEISKVAKSTGDLDRTFPKRLLRQMHSNHKYTSYDILSQLHELEKHRLELSDIGLLTETEAKDNIINELDENDATMLSVLHLYVKDSWEKLKRYDTLYEKLSLLKEIINSRFKHKLFLVDSIKGFVILPHGGKKENEIPVELLSSGEQNELVLFYELLFKCDSKDFILIDEPEISLHLEWLQSMIGDLIRVAEKNKVSLLIATHSPDLVGENYELVQHLS